MTQQDQELEQIKAKIQDHLISSGNYDKINKQLKLQLYESGWYDRINRAAMEGLEKNEDASFDELLTQLRPQAEQMVPETVKDETLKRIREYLEDVIQ